ncbi:hypothetical protein HDU76_004549 [Blyttiomyces sp. JEL0837]|nr:hypothetical protein HDU76_004549 [Blyttiomyces sp. JEL0837]
MRDETRRRVFQVSRWINEWSKRKVNAREERGATGTSTFTGTSIRFSHSTTMTLTTSSTMSTTSSAAVSGSTLSGTTTSSTTTGGPSAKSSAQTYMPSQGSWMTGVILFGLSVLGWLSLYAL